MASVQLFTTVFSPAFDQAHAIEPAGDRLWFLGHNGTDLVLFYSDDDGGSWNGPTVVDTADFLNQSLHYDATNDRLNICYANYNNVSGTLQFRAITSNVTSGTPGSLTTEQTLDGGANIGVTYPMFVHTDTGSTPRYWIIAQKNTAAAAFETRAYFVTAGSAADTAANWSSTNFTDLGANSSASAVHQGMGVWWTVGGTDMLTFVFMSTAGTFEAVTFDPTAGTPTPGTVTAVASGYGTIDYSTNLELFSINAVDDYLVIGLFDIDDSTVDFLSTPDGTTWNAVNNGTNLTMGRHQITRSGNDLYVLYSTPYGAMASTDAPLEYRKITASTNTIDAAGTAFSDSEGNNLTVPLDTGTDVLHAVYRSLPASPFSIRYDFADISPTPGVGGIAWLNATLFSATTLISDFTGSDENPLSEGGNWANLNTSLNPLQRVANEAGGNSGASASYWTPANFGPDLEAYATVPVAASGVGHGIAARIQGEGGAGTWDGYRVIASTAGGRIDRITNAVATALTAVDSVGFASGDKIGIRCIGNEIQLWRQASGSDDWILRLSAIDTTYPSAGKIALQISGTTTRTDDFYARTL